MEQERLLVISAHALDYLWRCGGTIAKYAGRGSAVKVIDLTCGERGESNDLWKNADITVEEVVRARKRDACRAAEILGVEMEFMDWQDHMLEVTGSRTMELAEKIQEFQPTIVLTHFTADPMNPDHPAAARIVIEAFRCAKTLGVFPGKKPCGPAKLFMFEPAYTEAVGYVPDVYIDITETMGVKMQAMEAVGAQRALADAYDKRNGYRGHLAAKLAGKSGIRYAETFRRFQPYVGDILC